MSRHGWVLCALFPVFVWSPNFPVIFPFPTCAITWDTSGGRRLISVKSGDRPRALPGLRSSVASDLHYSRSDFWSKSKTLYCYGSLWFVVYRLMYWCAEVPLDLFYLHCRDGDYTGSSNPVSKPVTQELAAWPMGKKPPLYDAKSNAIGPTLPSTPRMQQRVSLTSTRLCKHMHILTNGAFRAAASCAIYIAEIMFFL